MRAYVPQYILQCNEMPSAVEIVILGEVVPPNILSVYFSCFKTKIIMIRDEIRNKPGPN